MQAPGKRVSCLGKNKSVLQHLRREKSCLQYAVRSMLVASICPPFFIPPRVNMKESLMNGTPPGSKGVVTKSDYMKSDLFTLEYLPIFVKQIQCTPESPVLLILDSHSSHISVLCSYLSWVLIFDKLITKVYHIIFCFLCIYVFVGCINFGEY